MLVLTGSILAGAALQTPLALRTPCSARAAVSMNEDLLTNLREENARLMATYDRLEKERKGVPPPPRAGGLGGGVGGAAAAVPGPLDDEANRDRLKVAGALTGSLVLGSVLINNLPSFFSLPSGVLQEDKSADAIERFFPGALGSKEIDDMVAKALYSRGYTPTNTLFATSTCPDEVNYKEGEMLQLMTSRWGESFSLGGLGGVPFVGKSGFGAYAHHAPSKDGKMLIVFAPHVGVEYDGKVGALRRVNQDGVSTACGAAIGAYNAIMKDALASGEALTGTSVTPATADYFDAQIAFIKNELKPRLVGVEKSADPMAFVAYQMFLLIREFFVNTIITAPGLWDDANELAVLGGIQINTGKGGDKFMPLMFQTRGKENGTSKDLYEETFGRFPNLRQILGNKAMAISFDDYDLDTLAVQKGTPLEIKLPNAP